MYAASVWVFMFGVLFMLGAMVTSVVEVARILETVEYEHDRVEGLCSDDAPTGVGKVHPPDVAGEGMGL